MEQWRKVVFLINGREAVVHVRTVEPQTRTYHIKSTPVPPRSPGTVRIFRVPEDTSQTR
jgi:hypothetical protein